MVAQMEQGIAPPEAGCCPEVLDALGALERCGEKMEQLGRVKIVRLPRLQMTLYKLE